MSFWTFHSGRKSCVLVLSVRLDQKTKHAKWEMYEFQKYALHESIVTVIHFDITSSVWIHSLAYYHYQERIMVCTLLYLVNKMILFAA